MTSPFLRFVALVSLLSALPVAHAADANEERSARFKKMSEDAERAGLASPFVGITNDGTAQPGLFPVRATGVSTAPVRAAAETYLASLTPEQRAATQFAVDDAEWRKWMNQDFYVRQGVAFRDMTESQRAAAFGLMQASLSAKGLGLSRDIMKLNTTLGELANDRERYDEGLYWITIMGEPSANEPWGWQLDGHHLVVNYFVLGDQVVMSPAFFGSEPVTATAGKYRGTSILQEEQRRALAFRRSLDAAQSARAVLEVGKTGNNNLTEAFKDNVVLDYAGLRATELNAEQREALTELVALFVENMDEGHARVKMEEVVRHLDATFFAWIGAAEEDSVFYFRIHSPVVLIEFDHQRPINLRHLSKNPAIPTREHIHVVVRTPNGNDYGKDLLRQHYLEHRH